MQQQKRTLTRRLSRMKSLTLLLNMKFIPFDKILRYHQISIAPEDQHKTIFVIN
jgi:hypothetical protein